MKTGRSLNEVAAELTRQAEAKKDFLAPAGKVSAEVNSEGLLDVILENQGAFTPTPHFNRQLGNNLGIPAKHYDRLKNDHPDLLAGELNRFLGERPETKHLVRTLFGNARAWLSDRYRPLDNFDLAEAVLPKLQDANCEVKSIEVTDNRFYIKAIVPGLKSEIPGANTPDNWTWGRGHDSVYVVRPGIVISNSEVGQGALSISPAITEEHCTNLAVFNENAHRKLHLGRSLDQKGSEELWQLFTDSTKELADAAFWAQIGDVVDAALNGTTFDQIVNQLKAARGQKIEHPIETIEVVAKRVGLNEAEKKGVLGHLIRGGELSQYGVHAAITHYSQDEEVSYDRASELEKVGGDVVTLDQKDWASIIEATEAARKAA